MARDNVVILDVITSLNLPTDRIFEEAQKNVKIDDGVVIIGWDHDGMMYFSSSIADGPEVLWILEQTKLALLNVRLDDDDDT